MNIAHLVFTKYKNSFSVEIKNLELLSISQIKDLEHFVEVRNGIFDFNLYSFSIQKKLEFNEFVDLLEHLNLKAKCEEYIKPSTLQPRINFGQYKGMQYNELTDSYMSWLKVNYRGQDRNIIDKELNKRKL